MKRLALLLALIAVGAPNTSVARPARVVPRVLFVSDWSGTGEIYAGDAAGRGTAQITFGRAPACGIAPCGYDDPLPSPDGRYVLFTDWASCEPTLHPPSLFVARADGSHRRVLVRSKSKSRCISGVSGAWSPDSKRIAYNVDGVIHVVGLSGRNDRTVGRGTEFTWSPDGTSLAYQAPTGSLWVRRGARRARMIAAVAASEFTWSPNGRWLAYSFPTGSFGPDELDVIRPDGTGRRSLLTAYLLHPMWAGDSRLLAAWTTEGVAIVDVLGRERLLQAGSDPVAWRPHGHELAVERSDGTYLLNADTGAAKVVTRDRPAEAAWSPDGRSLAYVGPEAAYGRGDLRVVDVAGESRTIVRAAGAYGGSISDLRWTRPPAHARYQAPRPREVATVRDDGLTAPWPIVRIAAEGERVAYVSCGHVFLWTPSARSVVQTEPMASLSPRCSLPAYYVAFSIYTLAVSGDRVGYGELQGNMGQTWALHAGPVDDPARVTELAHVNSASGCAVGNGGLGDLTGAGGLLVFSRWRDNTPCPTKTLEQQIYRVDAGGCPCPAIAASPGALAPFDVDGGRIVAGGENATVVFDANGTQLTAIPVSPLAAELSGSHLVVLVQAQLRDYDAGSGALLHSWSLPDVPSGGECGSPHSGTWRCGNPKLLLEDAARGLVTYVLDGQVHILQLADGRDAPVGAGTLARFTATGLVYADDATLRLVPYAQLPIHP